MIHSKMWLVVKPTVGIPLMLGSVAIAALTVHAAILLNTTWYPAYMQGGARGARTSEVVVPTPSQVSTSGTAVLAQASIAAR